MDASTCHIFHFVNMETIRVVSILRAYLVHTKKTQHTVVVFISAGKRLLDILVFVDHHHNVGVPMQDFSFQNGILTY
jgi:hypothetical protein